jgi:large subunit ribosomal protein L32e
MHPSGFFEVLVASVKEVEGLDSKTQAVRISAAVGDRKRAALQEAAIAAGLRVLNARTVRSAIKKAPVDVEETKKKETKSPPPRIQAKKETKKAQPAPDTKEKRAPVKSIKKAAKPKAEKSEEKQEISKANVPVKSAKKAAKPKAEKSEESQKANSKANTKPKADAKPKSKAKPKSGSEVKKND